MSPDSFVFVGVPEEHEPEPILASLPPNQTVNHGLSRLPTLEELAVPSIYNSIDVVPRFVFDYAPLVHLHSNEPFWPASLEVHLRHTVLRGPEGQSVASPPDDPFSILARADLNSEMSYLTATDDVRTAPRQVPWLVSADGKPGPDRRSSISPVLLILVDKSLITGVPGTLDAFWFFFYSLNFGSTVANIHFGNHVGDWEHCMVRFVDGKPKAVHLSAHADGTAYTYESLEKMDGTRPVVYSALGSHANYPKPGYHYGSLAKVAGPIDQTDQGPLWDPVLNFAAFQHYPTRVRNMFRAIDDSKDGKLVPCLNFCGKWGNKFSGPVECSQLDNSSMSKPNVYDKAKDEIQKFKDELKLGHLRWVDGTTGPRDKDLDRIGMNRIGNKIHTSL